MGPLTLREQKRIIEILVWIVPHMKPEGFSSHTNSEGQNPSQETCLSLSWSRNSPSFNKPESSIPHSQQSAVLVPIASATNPAHYLDL
jgi:hypothetical protein